ncbi:MAG: glutamate-5-semialdehyde dehydrogenase [Candidatus Omnitrophota bacterium]
MPARLNNGTIMNAVKIIKEITTRARAAQKELSVMSSAKKNELLLAMADGLKDARDLIKKANDLDIANAKKSGKNKSFLDRLTLTDCHIDAMSKMFRNVAGLVDPIGEVIEKRERPNGLIICKKRVPIGVIGIIYEARPNVTADSIALCLKSGNCVILRGGTDAINSNKVIYAALKASARKQGCLEDIFILIEDTSHALVDAMLEASGGIDLIIPRGGESLIREVTAKSRVPVIKHYKGICHVYVDRDANLDMAEKICVNAKVQRPGVCNAMETMLAHESIASDFLPGICEKLIKKGVLLKVCSKTKKILKNLGKGVQLASDKDFATEWLDMVLNIKIVSSMEEAIEHIAVFGSNHSDAIVTENKKNGEEFTNKVDSAAVYINASTRFTDGAEFGKGAEIGISTDKLHARGPMGLEELCSYKYVIYGNGHTRE